MPDRPEPGPPDAPVVLFRLREAARSVRDLPSLEPEVRAALAELLDELTRAVEAPGPTPAAVAHLAESAVHLADSLHHARRDRGLLGRARDRLGEVVARAESH